MKKISKPELWQVVRFGIVGVVSVSVFYGILYGLTQFMHVWYLLSDIIAYIFLITSNFILHKFWTFKNTGMEKARKQMFRYLILCIAFFLANTLSMYILVDSIQLYYIYAQIILTVILSIISYFLTKRIFAK